MRVFSLVAAFCTLFEWQPRCCQRADTMELAWDVDVFARRATCVLCRRMCRLNSFGLGRIYKLTRPFSGVDCSESPTPIFTSTPINTESAGGAGGARARGCCSVNLMHAGWMENTRLAIFFSASFEFDYISTRGRCRGWRCRLTARRLRVPFPQPLGLLYCMEFGERSCDCWQPGVIFRFSAVKPRL